MAEALKFTTIGPVPAVTFSALKVKTPDACVNEVVPPSVNPEVDVDATIVLVKVLCALSVLP